MILSKKDIRRIGKGGIYLGELERLCESHEELREQVRQGELALADHLRKIAELKDNAGYQRRLIIGLHKHLDEAEDRVLNERRSYNLARAELREIDSEFSAFRSRFGWLSELLTWWNRRVVKQS